MGWMAWCPETGGRLFRHTEPQAREAGREAYSPKEYLILPGDFFNDDAVGEKASKP